MENQPDARPPENSRRRHLLLLISLVFLAAAVGWGAYWLIHGRYHETTDDGYVAGNLLRVTPREAGSVTAVLVDNTDYVKPRQILVTLDPADAQVALDQAEADLADTVRSVRQLFEARDQQRANLALKERALEQAEADEARRARAVAAQVVSREEAEHADTMRDQAKLELQLARAQLAAARAAIAGTTVESHPSVKQAEARVQAAWLALERCKIRAPEAGYIAERSVQIGQQVASGTPLMAVVPLSQVWVEANFKEDQLRSIRIGQPATLVSDLYGGSRTFHGTVVGLAPGTGSVFSLLPAQNATGNWIKIVQRLPVRIALDPKELAEHPLRVGLSMNVDVDIHDKSGPVLGSNSGTRYQETGTNGGEDKAADQLIRRIVRANLGRNE
jgi:membrane fusion protein, multidrug efflux system